MGGIMKKKKNYMPPNSLEGNFSVNYYALL